MRSSSTIRLAATGSVIVFLVAIVLVLTTALRAEDLGPIIVYGLAAACIVLLLFAPSKS